MGKAADRVRATEFPIDPLFTNRWSPRSFLEKEVPEDILFSLFEAAKWAASANNLQPWKFIMARTEQDRKKFHSFILPGNLVWCQKAPVFALILSEKTRDGKSIRTHAFDTGMASANLALEATNKGLVTHFMGGIDMQLAREVLDIPEQYEIQALLAIGYQGEKESLPEDLQHREKPSGRKELKEIVFEGSL
jgi:nitroreductase